MKRIIIVICFMTLLATAGPGDTNAIFLPIDFNAYRDPQTQRELDAKLLERAKKLPECKPAEQDPDGNWGKVTNGLQLSIRFAKRDFAENENITAFIILRNTSTNAIVVPSETAERVAFTIQADSQHTRMSLAQPDIRVSGALQFRLPPMRQVKYEFDLTDLYGLKLAGKYSVQATWLTNRKEPAGLSGPSSTKTTIIITAKKP